MDIKIKECLENKHDSYILPFLWLHGEPKERVREEIIAIKNSGIREFCAESRPYEEFCKEQWWDDFGYILETARELDMKVWLLDDRAFPTGYANGYLEKEENADLCKRLIREFQIEVAGPMKSAKLYVGGRVYEGEQVLQIVAYRHEGTGESLDYQTAVDLTSALDGDMVYWDIPKGTWRVCITVETRIFDHKDDRFFYYIDMLSRESCHAMIDAIYAPHYDHFKEYFGNTFRGFFSDEPAFLNVLFTYYNKLGVMHSPYPWREDLPELIAQSAGVDTDKVKLYMPALWEDLGEITSLIRMHYMEVITKLYRDNFSYQLGDWCRQHGVQYIGHVIEDMGAHTRMGYGSGHYFRALDGQDMAGIDIVLTQDIPGVDCIHRALLTDGGAADPAFFHYTLPKLASSHAHIQPLKKNRAMCEIFGAFGWAEGLPFMKGLADLMLSSGVNYFVPHAFSPKEEDEDCPPHFYNGGKNIQYPLFKNLMEYMGRCSHALGDGAHICDVAVFYNAEGEWTGGKNQLFYDLCRNLTQNLIDFDIVPYDNLADAQVKDGRLYINGESYGALIISESEIMPKSRLELFDKLAESGLPVIFENSLPKLLAEGENTTDLTCHMTYVKSGDLPFYLRAHVDCRVNGEGQGIKYLRYYHVVRQGKHIYLFSNEDVNNDINARISLEWAGECMIYEPWENKCYKYSTEKGSLNLHLEKGNMIFVIFGDEIPSDLPSYKHEVERKALPLLFDIYAKDEDEAEYRLLAENSALFDVTAPGRLPKFSGTVRYVSEFEYEDGYDVLDLGQVGDTAEVWLNGKYIGARINAPYKFLLRDALIKGTNKLEILVRSNLGHRRHDLFSTFIQIPPTGIMGDISLCKYEK